MMSGWRTVGRAVHRNWHHGVQTRWTAWCGCHPWGVVLAVALLTLGTARPVHAQATAYLPLNLEPEMERQVERVLILADEPILKRPYSVELVKLALPQACRVDHVLCRRVKRYLERYSRDYAVTHASITASYTHNGAGDVVPNEYGLPENSHYDLSIAAFVQPSDYLLASAGGIRYSGRTVPTGSMLTLGTNWAQIDVGWRPHWLSPLTDTSALISTEAPTTPSITLSNWEPLTRLGFQYELALLKMDQTGSGNPPGGNIRYNGVLSRGNPKIFTAQFSIEPFPGWSIGTNRLLQYGGGSGLPRSTSFLFRDFFVPSGLSQTQGNQQASYVTRFVSPTRVPFALYFQYAGEDTELGGAFLLGSPMMSGGIDFPRVFRHFDVTYEISEWSNIWYVHNIFLDGTTNNGIVEGNWGAQERVFNDGVGARSQTLRVGWSPPFGGYLEEKVRLLTNQNYFGGDNRVYNPADRAYPYHHYVDVSVRYTRPWNGLTLGGEAEGGHDVFGKNFARLSGFVRYGGDSHTRDEVDNDTDEEDETRAAAPPRGAEWFVDVGGNVNRVITAVAPLPSEVSSLHFGGHFGLGGRRAVSEHNDLGARVEYDGGVDGHYLIGFRFLDYRYRFDNPLALGLFLGAARYSTITPATSLYAGLGVQWRDIWRHWDLDLDGRYGDNLARDHVLASDFQGTRPETFYRIQSLALYLSRHF
jgi:Capsule assembly protein Wzi